VNLQAIRAEIEAKRKDDDKPNLDYTYSINEGYNQAIDEVLAKLDSHIEPKSEPKDKPYHRCPVCDGRGFVPFPGRIYTVGN